MRTRFIFVAAFRGVVVVGVQGAGAEASLGAGNRWRRGAGRQDRLDVVGVQRLVLEQRLGQLLVLRVVFPQDRHGSLVRVLQTSQRSNS